MRFDLGSQAHFRCNLGLKKFRGKESHKGTCKYTMIIKLRSFITNQTHALVERRPFPSRILSNLLLFCHHKVTNRINLEIYHHFVTEHLVINYLSPNCH